MKKVRAVYKEPNDYFPEDILKKHKLGKYADESEQEKTKEETEKRELNKKFRDYVNGK